MKIRPTATVALTTAALFLSSPAGHAAEAPARLPSCTEVSTANGDYEQKSLVAKVEVTDPVLVGGDWQPIKGSVANIGDKDLSDVEVMAYPWRQAEFEDPTFEYLQFQMKAADGSWHDLLDMGSKNIDVIPSLKAGETKDYDLRVKSGPLPQDPMFVEFAFIGGFADVYRFPDTGKEVDCRATSNGNDVFKIQGASTQPTQTATPSPTTSTSTPAATPTTATPAPTTTTSSAPAPTPTTTAPTTPAPGENLAETGSSGATTTLAVVGGAIVVLGAAAVFFTRRRKA
ncbi:LAETG motif-containing sortase-dependent surface protein [Streptomyces sp. NPDC006482]|uniref:LAETG motif-containing sortase-dependent surface protein n=1 Tax=Streptomyces sp. NPDC006482 TaxID=3154306 RepID=UPI0033A27F0C